MPNHSYTATYAFNEYLQGQYREAVPLIIETVDELQREGLDIEFLGATQEIDGAGQLIRVTARYSAPSKGAIGRLNCEACLPASGPPLRRPAPAPDRRFSTPARGNGAVPEEGSGLPTPDPTRPRTSESERP